MEAVNKVERKANFECMRIVLMCMIIGLHYLDKGGILVPFLQANEAHHYVAWAFEAFFLCAVNGYVMLSGYFSWKQEVQLKKVFRLWGQVLFYSLTIAVVTLCAGLWSVAELDIYKICGYIFPVITEQYWFVTNYVVLFLLLPFLNPVIQNMEQKNMRNLLLLFVGVFSVSKTLLPLSFPIDKNGYDVLWFLCLYLTGAYMGRFGFGRCNTKGKGLALYAVSSCGILGLSFVVREVALATGFLQDRVTYAYSYNHLLCYTAAIGLFVFFAHVTIPDKMAAKAIRALGGATFGVYLIHEHVNLRYAWPQWLGTWKYSAGLRFVLPMFASIVAVFFVCALVELLRKKMASVMGKGISKQR